MFMWMGVCVCVCVCERERERERLLNYTQYIVGPGTNAQLNHSLYKPTTTTTFLARMCSIRK